MAKSKQVEAVYSAVGGRVRYIREVLDMSQEQLAKEVGLTRPSIANFETGHQRCMLHDIEKMAVALKTTPRNLFKGIWT